ncbi:MULTISPECIES: P-II family nitrogen regulator [unclassified Phyllobacterium]|uniref:P-II family nitrogen regulator n=1 Tax=unclassified Phyllobacterium TaxID=2638441 RepID=UPI003012CF88
MKKIEAIIRPFVLTDVRKALEVLDVQEITTFEAMMYPFQNSYKEQHRGASYEMDFLPMIKVEIVADENRVEAIIEAIGVAAAMNQAGGGKVDVLNIERVV